MALLDVEDLSIEFKTMRGVLRAVDRVSFQIEQGETLGIVGESGCGKSISSLAIMRLLPSTARVHARKLSFLGRDLQRLTESQYQDLRGGDIAMIFQDPMTSLNPSFTVGFQIVEVLEAHQGGSTQRLKKRAIELLDQVGIPDAATRFNAYPHQLSGGMSQRVMIAIAIACKPKLLIADEPTTALDVTIQTQILELLRSLQRENGMSLILITHDIGIVAEYTDRTMVMYAGQAVETGKTTDVILKPTHPYTEGLLACLPGTHTDQEHRTKLPTIAGLVPDLVKRPPGCQLHPRCKYVNENCRREEPALVQAHNRNTKCFYPLAGRQ